MDASVPIPQAYEILKTIDTPGQANEYIARHKLDNVTVRLKMFNFRQTAGTTTRRHLREYLRCDITFMEELDIPDIIRIFDYSDTKNLLWLATYPHEVEKLSDRFDFLKSQPFQSRQQLVQQFLTALQRIHNSQVIHRNLSSDAVFLSPEDKIYIGDFGFATYITDQPTLRHDTISVTTVGYLPPEVRNAQTFACDVSGDIFSAGLLAFEILTAEPLPKDHPGEIHRLLSARLNDQIANTNIGAETAQTILRAVDPTPQKRWSTAEDFAKALEGSLQNKSPYSSMSADFTPTVAVDQPRDSSKTLTVGLPADSAQQAAQPPAPPEAAADITPLDPSHEIWNNRYEILKKIGEGGQAVVYKAYDHLTNEEIAIKTIWSHHRSDRAAINRLKQGAMVARSLTHRYIIKTYSVEQRIDTEGQDRYVFICMELIKSQMELSDVIEERRASGKKFRLDEVLHVIRQLLDALKYAHEHTIHRDIKPGNIMLVPHGEQTEVDSSDLTKFNIRLIDFGIAKVLSQKHIDVTGKGFRSAHYGAPELVDVKTGVDARADIYSVGVMMYQMLTKNIPRKSSPPANKANKDVPAALAKVIDKAMNADRQKRFKSVSELIKEIDKAVSKFNWVRKAAKIAAVLLLIACIGGAVKYFIPEPDKLPIQESIKLLQDRKPDKEISTLANATIVKYTDIAGYNSYNKLRETAVEKLETVAEATADDKFERNYAPWQQQESLWLDEFEPAVGKIESIAQNQREYNARKDIVIADHLMKLEPSSKIVGEVKTKAQKAQELLQNKPFKKDDLDFCSKTYDLSARVYTNISILAGDSQTPQRAEQINTRLKGVDQLRNNFLAIHSSLNMIEPLKDHDFQNRSDKCFQKADGFYRSYSLQNAEKYLNLLNQICSTLVYVHGQVDFGRSDIALVSSRLMDLCHDDIETFENYPLWKEKLEQVYRRKDILARYVLIQNLLSKGPKDVPVIIYDHTVSAKKLYEEGNLNSAGVELADATEEYREFLRRKVNDLIGDCDSLLTFSYVSSESIRDCKNGLDSIAGSIDQPIWPQVNFIDEYNRYSAIIKNEKNAVREKLTDKATDLKKTIVDSKNNAQQQQYFYNSRKINNFVTVAKQYDSDDIDTSIENWKHVEDLRILSSIVNQMESLNLHLETILGHRNKLDKLANDIDRAITFCEKFKGISTEERKKYKQFGSDLKNLRARLTTPQHNTYLIDQTDELFAAECNNISSAFSEIRVKLAYHRSRVVELINKSHSLEKTADYLNQCRQLWADAFGQQNTAQISSNFSQMRTYLESVKEDVDNWSIDNFNNQMRERCRSFNTALNEQRKTAAAIISNVLDHRTRLIENLESFEEKVNEILNDNDIRTLDNLAAAADQPALLKFRQLPSLLKTAKQKISKITLSDTTSSVNPMPADSAADFEIDDWLIKFNTEQVQLNTRISQMQVMENSIPAFQESLQILAKQSDMETGYYLALRDSAVSLIDYSDVTNKIDALENDSVIIKMCKFLEQMENDSVPGLKTLKASLSKINNKMTYLKSAQINTIAQARDFNKQRQQLLKAITPLQQQVSGLNRTNLENTCKQTITQTVSKIKTLLESSNQDDTVKRLTSSLWAFLPGHRDWSQWADFLKLYHITASEQDLSLSTSDFLRPVNDQGNFLNLDEIAANPTNAFYSDASNPANFGWPRYVGHQKDPTVVLAFIPASDSGDTKPFYMAIREITNTQYRLFLEKSGAKQTYKLAGWSFFGDQNGKLLIGQAQGQFPPSRITLDNSTKTFVVDEQFEHAPVTWVTSHGGQAFAQWLDAKLPSTVEYSYAAKAGSAAPYPWGDELSQASSYAHVRSVVWQEAARQYNRKRDNPVEIAYPPVCAVKDFVRGKALDSAKIVHATDSGNSVWPCFTKSRPNAFGLYDMIGNVWEWSLDAGNNQTPVICGGSCLSPPQDIAPDSKRQFKVQACDVGFRIIIPAN